MGLWNFRPPLVLQSVGIWGNRFHMRLFNGSFSFRTFHKKIKSLLGILRFHSCFHVSRRVWLGSRPVRSLVIQDEISQMVAWLSRINARSGMVPNYFVLFPLNTNRNRKDMSNVSREPKGNSMRQYLDQIIGRPNWWKGLPNVWPKGVQERLRDPNILFAKNGFSNIGLPLNPFPNNVITP